jgi:transcriptional regulator with XRE-family HTH domain
VKATKRKKLEEAGWKAGSTSEFLGLSNEEELLVNIKLVLASEVKKRRQRLKLTQQELAQRLGSSQSRVAKLEIADSSVSMELLVRSLASLGASRAEIGRTIGTRAVTRKQPKTRQPALTRRSVNLRPTPHQRTLRAVPVS